MIIFKEGSVPVRVAAKVYHKDPSWIRVGIREGWLPIGIATRKGTRWNYYISPLKLYEETGYVWRGYDSTSKHIEKE